MQIRMTSNSLNWVQTWIWYFDRLDIPNILAIGDDWVITAEVSTLGQGSDASAAKFCWIGEDLVSLLLNLDIWVIIRMQMNWVMLLGAYLLNIVQELWVDWPKFSLATNLFEDFHELLWSDSAFELHLVVLLTEEEADVVSNYVLNSGIGGIFRSKQETTVHCELDWLRAASLLTWYS